MCIRPSQTMFTLRNMSDVLTLTADGRLVHECDKKKTLIERFSSLLRRRPLWPVPASSPGARPLPGVRPGPAQAAGGPQRPDGARWVSFRVKQPLPSVRETSDRRQVELCAAGLTWWDDVTQEVIGRELSRVPAVGSSSSSELLDRSLQQ